MIHAIFRQYGLNREVLNEKYFSWGGDTLDFEKINKLANLGTDWRRIASWLT